ncbi:hypothetical protein [Fimbriiglobus ruber]|nr:hypothetical protein [Fimbriiglobus ruber]
MRMTGIVVMILGVVIALFCAGIVMVGRVSAQEGGGVNAERYTNPDLFVPMVIAGVALLGGWMLYMMGGRGYKITNDPALR